MTHVDTHPLSTPFRRTILGEMCLSTDEPLTVYTPVHTHEDMENPMKSNASYIVYSVYTLFYNIGKKCKYILYRGGCSQVWTPVDRWASERPNYVGAAA